MMLSAIVVMLTVIYVDYTNFHPTLNVWSAKENASYQSLGIFFFS